MPRLFIIGNGVDLANGLPTDFHNHFRPIAKRNERYPEFWRLYSDAENEIWSDFEESLARPELERLWAELFQPYSPDYLSDHESDRNGMIHVAEETGNLKQSLQEFAQRAEKEISNITTPALLPEFPVRDDDHIVSFNYTSTVESKYNVRADQIAHVHGKVGDAELTIGFNRARYKPTDVFVDVHHGQGYWTTWDIYAKKQTPDDIPEEQREYYDEGDYYVDASQKVQGNILGKQGEVSVERIEAEVMLPRMLCDEQIRNAHFVDAVPQTNRLQFDHIVPVGRQRETHRFTQQAGKPVFTQHQQEGKQLGQDQIVGGNQAF